ncbi:MAG TPA: pilus assembly protein PilM [bacterium]|nr:pilus assembly protein PilM [bacterium]HPL95677.1 pilus assembly protein PilM [bacterium]
MGLFSSHPSYLGVDIGSAGIKVVELRNENGRPRLLTYGFAEEPVDIIHDNSPKMAEKIAILIKKICQDSQVSSKKTIAALPTFSVFSSIISLPSMEKKDIVKAVYWQAKKIVPMPLEEMTLDWKLLESGNKVKEVTITEKKSAWNNLLGKEKEKGENDNNKNDLKVLIAAAPKKLVLRYVAAFQQAGLDLLSLETENFAMERSMVGGDRNPVMMVDVGNITSDITVVENSIPILSRSVDVGGHSITQAIINSMHVDEKRAEQFKRDIGFANDQSNLPKIIESVINPIINEIKYCFDLYASAQSERRIEKIILTGGSSFLPQIDKYLAQLLNIKVYIGDPWARVIYPLELKPILMSIAPRLSVAVGLAMREIV